jgi:hypothetical protein
MTGNSAPHGQSRWLSFSQMAGPDEMPKLQSKVGSGNVKYRWGAQADILPNEI